jgi:hypothetical protein
MGKSTNPSDARKRQKANDTLSANSDIERINGVDRNNSVSPVVAWRAKRMLEEGHEAAIAYCFRLWDTLAKEPRTTANYGEQTDKSHDGAESGAMILRRMEAQEDLERIYGKRDEFGTVIKDGYIPVKWWQIFENCVRFDEPTGFLGSKLHGGTKTARAKAHVTVCMVADVIAMKEGLLGRAP